MDLISVLVVVIAVLAACGVALQVSGGKFMKEQADLLDTSIAMNTRLLATNTEMLDSIDVYELRIDDLKRQFDPMAQSNRNLRENYTALYDRSAEALAKAEDDSEELQRVNSQLRAQIENLVPLLHDYTDENAQLRFEAAQLRSDLETKDKAGCTLAAMFLSLLERFDTLDREASAVADVLIEEGFDQEDDAAKLQQLSRRKTSRTKKV